MRIMTWDIDSGGREKIEAIINSIEKEDCEILVITGFRVNHNKENFFNELRGIGYKYFVYNRQENKYKDTVLIVSRDRLNIIKYNSRFKESFLIVEKDDVYIAGMNFTNNKTQKELVEVFNRELSQYKNKHLIVAGNMQTAQNYAMPNSLNKQLCKKYLNFDQMGFNNCIVECGYAKDTYSWKSKKSGEYNVDFILANKKIDLSESYCYYNSTVKEDNISSHSIIVLNLIIKNVSQL